jgi:diguanylate cyclase (GGDEF)-like protein
MKDHAFAAAERLRRAVADTPVTTDSGPLPVTISIGVAELKPGTEDLESLLSDADHALYAAKRSGRNAVSMSDA